MSASLARSVRFGLSDTANARVMWLQNSTEMPTACQQNGGRESHCVWCGKVDVLIFTIFVFALKTG